MYLSVQLAQNRMAHLRYAIAACLILFSALTAHAQIETGQLTGKITDATGAALPGVTITVRAVATASERKTTSNDAGLYALTNLQPGSYEITAAAKDFLPNVLKLQVTVGSRHVFDFTLEPLPANAKPDAVRIIESPDVSPESISQTLSTVVTQKQIRDLPSLTRNPYDFVFLAGNVAPLDPTRRTNSTAVAINGQRPTSVNFLQDGQVNNSQFAGNPGQRVPLESVQEFSVISGGLSAEYGRAAGGIVNVVTKTGTNSLHGTAFGFNRLSALASKDYNASANGLEKGTFTRNQYGYSVGGPAIKDKLLFFNATEWTKVRSRADVISIAPSSDLVSASAETTRTYFGKYSLRTTLPSDNDDNANKLYTKAEIANLFSIVKGGSFDKLKSDRIVFGQVVNRDPVDAGGGDPQDTLQSVVRLDYNFSNKETVALRYGTDRQTLFDGTNSNSPWGGFNTGTQLQNDTFSLSLTQAHNARLTTQTRLAGNRMRFTQPLGSAGEAPGLYFYANGTPTIDGYEIVLPGYQNNNSARGSRAIPYGGPQNVYQIYQDGTYLWGKNTIRFGGQYNYTQDNRTNGALQNSVQVLGNEGNFGQAIDNLIKGKLYSFTGAIDPRGKGAGEVLQLPAEAPNFTRSYRYHEAAAYVNAAWRLRRNLTFNGGVRYDFFSVPHNSDKSLDSNFIFGTGANAYEQIRNGRSTLTSKTDAKGFYKRDLNNYAPRVGFAWDVFGDGKTSVRGGFGIAYERAFDAASINLLQNSLNYAEVNLVAGQNIGGIDITDSNTGPFDDTGRLTLQQTRLTAIDQNLKTASARFWNFSVQRELSRNLVLSADYSGSQGRDLYSLSNINRIGSGNVYLGDNCTTGQCTARLNTLYSDINYLTNDGASDYHGVTVGIDGRNFLTRGLLFNARYTWSQAKDNLSSALSEGSNNFNLGFLDPFNPALDRGYADFDMRHRAVMSGVWDIPYEPGLKPSTITGYLYKHLLSNISMSGLFTMQSGTPFTVYDCTKSASNTCIRAIGTAATSGSINPQETATPNRFEYIDLRSLKSGSYINAITGTSIYGPFPSNMTARNAFRGPRTWNFDTAIYKTFGVKEWFTMQVRAEVYNVFNHANWYVIGNETDISRYSYAPARRDGRRIIQFALRLIF